MFCWVIIISMFFLFLLEEAVFLKRCKNSHRLRLESLRKVESELEKEERLAKKEVESIESSLAERFLFYDMARRISPILKKKDVFNSFCEEIRYLGPIDFVLISATAPKGKYLKFELEKGKKEALYLKAKSKDVVRYIPYFVKLLQLCLERINLYDKFQELSIHDQLTKVYNRRYFMTRYFEEFARAKKFNINLSFLMLDIDRFKKINDTYGHLVGDTVLRDVARLIGENIREIDFLARFGGEEFVAILSETDKAGAIMVAERISSRISRSRIKVFDESIAITVSIGVATFPQNTLHSDVLVEIADKALYKAKLSGRNRVCWF